MDLTNQIISNLMPDGEPPGSYILPEILQNAKTLELEQERRGFLWAAAAEYAFYGTRQADLIPGFQYASAGFVPVDPHSLPPDYANLEFNTYVFGVAVSGGPIVEGMNLQDFRDFKIESTRFVVVVRRSPEELHQLPQPSGATSTCWASSLKPNLPGGQDGVLTALHAVQGMPLGQIVQLNYNHHLINGTLADYGSPLIDAALIAVPSSTFPVNPSSLVLRRAIAPGTDVSFFGNGSKLIKTAKVTHAMYHPQYLGAYSPMRVFLDNYGQRGDSGALVSDGGSKGIGLYTGSVLVTPGQREGICQYLYQVKHLLRLNLFA